jgi:hypothetical protein
MTADVGAVVPRRILLHVGSPKTGTTFLQQVLWSQRELALAQGLLLPSASFHDHYLATVDVRERTAKPDAPPRAVGMWGRLVEEGRRWSGNVLISHELFAGTTAAQAERAVRAWGDEEVHVIVTARDLVRQIPAEWQEHIKHRSASTFSDFLDALRTSEGEAAMWFWTVQDYAAVCRAWGAAVPPERIHLVTVPPPGAPRDLLWRRFAGLLDLDPDRFDLVTSRANQSLRAEQVELLRRVNLGLGERLPMPGSYPATVKEVFAQDVLAGRPGVPVALTGDHRTFALKRSRDMVDELEQLGVDVVGDLADLIPDDVSDDSLVTEHPEATPDTRLLAESVEAIGALLERFSAEHERAVEDGQVRRRLADELSRARSGHTELQVKHERLVHDWHQRPVRHFVIGISEQHPRVMRIRVGYWRVVNAGRFVARLPGRATRRLPRRSGDGR